MKPLVLLRTLVRGAGILVGAFLLIRRVCRPGVPRA